MRDLKINNWAADLAEIETLSSKHGGVKYVLCVRDIFTKLAWVKSLKDQKATTALHGFHGIK